MTALQDRPIVWQPTPKQAEFLSSPAREALGGGSLGGGKTDALLMAGCAQSGNPKHRALFLRRTFPQLRDAIARSHELFLPLGAEYNRQSSTWRFPSGASLEFGFLDADEDRFRYIGRSFSCICWDELTSWPNESAYVFLMTRLRATQDSGLRLTVRSSCTPGGPGHSWCKARFAIPDAGTRSECVDPLTGYRREFVPFRIGDNAHLRGGEYERMLRALPEQQRKALVEGYWNVFDGAIFSEFDPVAHVREPFAIPNEWPWPIWRGCDDGFASPAACYWFAHDKTYDRVFVIAELYQSQLTAEALAQAILGIDAIVAPGRKLGGIIDSAAFSDTGAGSRGDTLNRLGCAFEPSVKGAGSRVAGWSLIHSRLALKSDGRPGLIIFRGCHHLLRTLPAAAYATRGNLEDIGEGCETHAIDALRYGLGRPPPSRTRLIQTTGV